MANPNNERVVVTEKDIEEKRISFEERSSADSVDEVHDYDTHPALRREIWGWYAYSWAVSFFLFNHFNAIFILIDDIGIRLTAGLQRLLQFSCL